MPSPSPRSQEATSSPISRFNLVNSRTYFKSPIETLVASIEDFHSNDISVSDLLHAYDTLSARIRFQIAFVSVSNTEWEALTPLRLHSGPVICALRRDIRRVLVESPGVPGLGTLVPQAGLSYEASGTDTQNTSLALELAHRALRFLSNVLRFPVLHTIFSAQSLEDLLNDLLVIAHAPPLSVQGTNKATALVTWILQTQRLPFAVLRPRLTGICELLLYNISTYPGRPGTSERISDSLKMVHNLLVNHGLQALQPLAKLLPSVLPHLSSSSLDVRMQTARALNGYVLAKIKWRISQFDDTLASHLQVFLQVQMTKFKAYPSDTCLSTTIRSAFAGDGWTIPSDGSFWAANVLASLVVLSDASVFSHPFSLKFFLPHVAQTLIHKRSAVRLLHPRLWHCLIWAFSRMLHVAGDSSISIGSQDAELVERAFRLIKQEINGGAGLSLATALIRSQEPSSLRLLGGVIIADPIFKALSIVEDMIFTGDAPTSAEGISFLAQLVHGNLPLHSHVEDDAYNRDDVLTGILFDGTLLQSSPQDIATAVKAMPTINIGRGARLSELDVLQNWDTLNFIWVKTVRKFQFSDSDVALPSNLLHIWQSLLLVHTQLTQERGHLTASQDHTDQFTSIVISFLTPEESSTTIGASNEQRHALSVVKQLWNVIKNVFSASVLTVIAEKVLAAILEHRYDLSDEEVKTAWSVLCSDLILTGDPTFSISLHAQNEHGKEGGIRRHLWLRVAKMLPSFDNGWSWEDLASFARVPLQTWNMSDQEIEWWERVFAIAVSRAAMSSITATSFIEIFMQEMNEDNISLFSSKPQLLLGIISHVILTEQEKLPIRTFLVVDRVLYNLYPPNPELFSISFRYFHAIRTIIVSAHPAFVVPILESLRRSLSRWIADESACLLVEEYNRNIMPVYCDALSILENLEPTLQALNAVASFLASAFVRAPDPALGPLAFKKFWCATYLDREDLRGMHPPDIQGCLKAINVVYAGNLANSPLSSNVRNSQSPSTSVVPDSQITPQRFANIHKSEAARFQHLYTRHSSGGQIHSLRNRLSPATPHMWKLSDFSSPVARNEISPEVPYSSAFSAEFRLASNPQSRNAVKSDDRNLNTSGVLQSVLNSETVGQSLTARALDFDKNVTRGIPTAKRAATDTLIMSPPGAETAKRRHHQREPNAGHQSERRRKSPHAKQEDGPNGPSIGTSRVRAQSDPMSSRKRALFDGVEVLTYKAFLKRRRVEDEHLPDQVSGGEDPQGKDLHLPPFRLSGGPVEQDLGHGSEARHIVQTSAQSQSAVPSTQVRTPPPLRRSRTASARLNALQEAYDAVTNHPSQLPAEDLMEAARLAHQMALTLNEQMGQRFINKRRRN